MKSRAIAGSGGGGALLGLVGSPLAQSTPWIKVFTFYTQSQRGGMVGQGGIVAIRYQQLALLALLMSLGVDRSVCGLEGIVGIR